MSIKVIVIKLLLCLSATGMAQSFLMDSLKQRLANAPTAIEEINILLGLARLSVFEGDFDAVEAYTERAIGLSQKHHDKVGHIIGLLYKSQALGELGKVDESFELTRTAFQMAKTAEDPTALMFAQYQLAECHMYYRNEDEKALQILEEALDANTASISPKLIGNVYKNIASCYQFRENYNLAEQYYQKALDFFQAPSDYADLGNRNALEIDNGLLNSGQINIYLSELYMDQNDHDKALLMAQKALGQLKKTGSKSAIAWANENLGAVMHALGDLQKELTYYQEALMIYENLGENIYASETYSNIANIYYELGDFTESLNSELKSLDMLQATSDTVKLISAHIYTALAYERLENLESTNFHIQKSLGFSYAISDSSRLSIIYFTLAKVARKNGNLQLALDYLKNALQMNRLYEGANIEMNILSAIGQLYFEYDQLDSASFYTKQALAFNQHFSDPYEEREVYKLSSNIHEKQGDFEQALVYFKAYDRLKDSIYTTDAQAILRQEQIRQDVNTYQEEKEVAILQAQLLKTRNRWYLGSALALSFLLLIGSYLFFQLRKTKQLLENKNQQLLKLNQTKDKFFGIIAHDIRSPILALENVGTQMDYYLKKGKMDKLQRLSQRVDTTAKRVTSLLDNLLNWALLQQGVIPHHPNTILLQKSVTQSVEMFQISANLKGVSLVSEVPKELKVTVDENALNTILRNLIGNAIKFTPKGGEVRISANLEDENVLIKVQDSGVGMNEQQVKSLFKLNSKSEKGTAGERGTGLGLILCQELIQLNKGSITAKSQPQKGSNFNITLPLAA